MTGPVAIEVRDLTKGFDIAPERNRIPIREQLAKPFKRRRGRHLEVLKGISFDIHEGEFFGIVGRNGSGKSTLLKILASVYGADSGSVRIAGQLAPFLELGVGFNPQLAAYDNVVLNGVMMGLTPDQARARFDDVVEFAGLGDYLDLPLKNYSSGMKVRLAFAVLTQVDADVLLMDEVLAVGDSEFQEKCEMVFAEMREAGKTVVLVTHSMQTVNTFCDRAMMIHDGAIEAIGPPLGITNRYLELNMRAAAAGRGDSMAAYATRFADVIVDPPLRVLDAWLVGAGGERNGEIGEREQLEFRVVAEVLRRVERPGFQFRLDDDRGQSLFIGGAADLEIEGGFVEPGERLEVTVSVENRLAPGSYVFAGGMAQRMPDGSAEPASPVAPLGFEVSGEPVDALLSLEQEVAMQRIESDVEVSRAE
jgi:ABC-2 type transport system ATP-binding protein